MQVAMGVVSLLKLRTVVLLEVVALVSALVASRGMAWNILALRCSCGGRGIGFRRLGRIEPLF